MSSAATGNSFALTPGVATSDPFDYSTALGMEKWSESTKKLGNELFDGDINILCIRLQTHS